MAQFKVEFQEVYNHQIFVDADSYIDAEEKAAKLIQDNPYNYLQNDGSVQWSLHAIERCQSALPSLKKFRAARDQISFAA